MVAAIAARSVVTAGTILRIKEEASELRVCRAIARQ
jgi:hypothetical protein